MLGAEFSLPYFNGGSSGGAENRARRCASQDLGDKGGATLSEQRAKSDLTAVFLCEPQHRSLKRRVLLELIGRPVFRFPIFIRLLATPHVHQSPY